MDGTKKLQKSSPSEFICLSCSEKDELIAELQEKVTNLLVDLNVEQEMNHQLEKDKSQLKENLDKMLVGMKALEKHLTHKSVIHDKLDELFS